MQKYAEHWTAQKKIPKTYREERRLSLYQKGIDSLLNLCLSGEIHLPGSGSEGGEMVFSGSHLWRLTFSSSTGAEITIQRLVSLKFRAYGQKIQGTLNRIYLQKS